eukprot:GILK01006335.1.p1 GENE.GILK01006335.1~~GILK01006335.1.p1  ORF type:complete len:850 (+),score=169.62 GILK01006335.1:70-2550(+)
MSTRMQDRDIPKKKPQTRAPEPTGQVRERDPKPASGGKTGDNLMKGRMLTAMVNSVGHRASVVLKNGTTYDGILHTANIVDREFGVALSSAKKVSGKTTDVDDIKNMLLLMGKDIVSMYVPSVSLADAKKSEDKFRTDTDISHSKSMSGVPRELQPWTPDTGVTDVDLSLDSGPSGRGWDQFKINKERYNVSSTYDESLYTTNLDKTKFTRTQMEQAEKLAREIEAKSAAGNIHMAEERGQHTQYDDDDDEEARYGAVLGSGRYQSNQQSNQQKPAARERDMGKSWRRDSAGPELPLSRGVSTENSEEGEHQKKDTETIRLRNQILTDRIKSSSPSSKSPLNSPLIGDFKRINALNLEPAPPKVNEEIQQQFMVYKEQIKRKNSRDELTKTLKQFSTDFKVSRSDSHSSSENNSSPAGSPPKRSTPLSPLSGAAAASSIGLSATATVAAKNVPTSTAAPASTVESTTTTGTGVSGAASADADKAPAPSSKLNPKAKTFQFSFNPSAKSFVPGGASSTTAAAQTPPPPPATPPAAMQHVPVMHPASFNPYSMGSPQMGPMVQTFAPPFGGPQRPPAGSAPTRFSVDRSSPNSTVPLNELYNGNFKRKSNGDPSAVDIRWTSNQSGKKAANVMLDEEAYRGMVLMMGPPPGQHPLMGVPTAGSPSQGQQFSYPLHLVPRPGFVYPQMYAGGPMPYGPPMAYGQGMPQAAAGGVGVPQQVYSAMNNSRNFGKQHSPVQGGGKMSGVPSFPAGVPPFVSNGGGYALPPQGVLIATNAPPNNQGANLAGPKGHFQHYAPHAQMMHGPPHAMMRPPGAPAPDMDPADMHMNQ